MYSESLSRKALILIVVGFLVVAINPFHSHAAGSVSGAANGAVVSGNVTVLGVPTTLTLTNAAPVTLPSTGGSVSNQVASVEVGVPGVLTVLSTGLIQNSSSGTLNASSAHAQSGSTVNGISILNGFITASTIRSVSTSDGNGSAANSSGDGSLISNLRVNGVLQETTDVPPNTQISASGTIQVIVSGLPVTVPVTATITLNAQNASGNGTTNSALGVTQMAVTVSGSVAGLISINANIAIAIASSGVNFTAAPNNCPNISVPSVTQTVQVGQTLTFNASATDPDGDTVTLQASNLPANASFTPNPAIGTPTATGTFNFTPAASQANQTFSVQFVASDNHGCSGSVPSPVTVQIQVTSAPPPNRCPTISVPSVTQTVQVGQTLTFSASATDPDGDTVTLQATNIPANGSFTPNPAVGTPTATGSFSFTPATSQVGQAYNVQFTASDNHGCSGGAPVTVQITVTPGNTPNHCPVVTVPSITQLIQVGQTLTFQVSATDPDGDTVTLQATSLPAGATFTPNPATGTPTATGVFSFTPFAAQANNQYSVQFTASDNHGCSGSGAVPVTVLITVTPAPGGNNCPIITVPPAQTIEIGQTLTFNVTATDPDGDTVTLTATGLPSGASFTPNPATGRPTATGTFSFTAAAAQAGQVFTVTFAAADDRGCNGAASGNSRTVTITVTSGGSGGVQGLCGNHPPIISVPTLPMAAVGQTLNFIVRATDQDGDTVTLSTKCLPDHANFSAATGRFTFTPDAEQLHQAQLGQGIVIVFIADDGKGGQSAALVDITPVVEQFSPKPPLLSVPMGPLVVKVVDKLIFGVAALAQVDGCPTSISASGLPASASFDQATNLLTFTPTADQVGKGFVVNFTATDCAGRKRESSVRLVVVDADNSCSMRGTGQADIVTKRVDFNTVKVGDSGGAVTVSITNRGGGNLLITDANLDDATNFSIEGIGTLPLTLQPGGVIEFRTRFMPKVAGTSNAVLTIFTSDPDNPALEIRLKGKANK